MKDTITVGAHSVPIVEVGKLTTVPSGTMTYRPAKVGTGVENAGRTDFPITGVVVNRRSAGSFWVAEVRLPAQ